MILTVTYHGACKPEPPRFWRSPPLLAELDEMVSRGFLPARFQGQRNDHICVSAEDVYAVSYHPRGNLQAALGEAFCGRVGAAERLARILPRPPTSGAPTKMPQVSISGYAPRDAPGAQPAG